MQQCLIQSNELMVWDVYDFHWYGTVTRDKEIILNISGFHNHYSST